MVNLLIENKFNRYSILMPKTGAPVRQESDKQYKKELPPWQPNKARLGPITGISRARALGRVHSDVEAVGV